ncbi:MAG: 3'-5' exonuclease [Solobacterium sp.]|nr:3'-5' exonuclease [Solobacterium sp.]
MNNNRVTAIDFETANKYPASVCAVGISVMEDGAVGEGYYTLIKVDPSLGPWSRWNIAVHGILPEQTENAPEFRDIYRDLCDRLENGLVCAHNARFDMGCLKAACLQSGRRIPYVRWFDTVELSRKVFPDLSHHRLNDMCDLLSIPLDHHNAASDAEGCILIVANIMELTGIYDIEELLRTYKVRIHEL